MIGVVSGGASIGAGGAVPYQEFSGNSFLFMKQFIPSKIQQETVAITFLALKLHLPCAIHMNAFM